MFANEHSDRLTRGTVSHPLVRLSPFTKCHQVCMSESMDTMVLPCRHLCLCNNCAEVLRYQASKCPICRAPFHSLLKISVAKREEDLTPEQLDREQVRSPVLGLLAKEAGEPPLCAVDALCWSCERKRREGAIARAVAESLLGCGERSGRGSYVLPSLRTLLGTMSEIRRKGTICRVVADHLYTVCGFSSCSLRKRHRRLDTALYLLWRLCARHAPPLTCVTAT